MQTKTILRYPGSKARFASLIEESIVLNGCDTTTFAEPFCGGASVSITLLEKGAVESIALNDADPLISALWACVFSAKDARWLSDQALSVPLTIEEWCQQKSLTPANRREAALKCLYLNRTSFNGIIHKSGPIGGWGQEKRTLGARFNRERLAQRILALSAYQGHVTISNKGWMEFCNHASKHRGAFLYLDPPYYYKAKHLYRFAFDTAEHTRLRDYLIGLKSPWLLSYDDSTEVRGLYHGHDLQVRVVDNTYSTHPLGGMSFIGRELIYSNLDKLPPPSNKASRGGVMIHHDSPNAAQRPARVPLSVKPRAFRVSDAYIRGV